MRFVVPMRCACAEVDINGGDSNKGHVSANAMAWFPEQP